MLKETTVSPEDFGTAVAGEAFEVLGAVDYRHVGALAVAENEGD